MSRKVTSVCVCRVDYGHAEAAHKYGSDPRKYNVMSKKFVTDDQGHVRVSYQGSFDALILSPVSHRNSACCHLLRVCVLLVICQCM